MTGILICALSTRIKEKEDQTNPILFRVCFLRTHTTIHSNPAPWLRSRGSFYFSTPIRSRTVRVRQKSSLTLMTPPPVPLSAPEAIAFCTAGL